MSHDGFVELKELLRVIQEQYREVNEIKLRRTIEEDPKGRYELQEDRVRARYGHSIDISVELPQAAVDRLYHGTTPKASRQILHEGLKQRGRQKVHLSVSIRDAIEVGKRRCKEPVVLEIDVKGARKAGVRIEKASEHVYVMDEVPARFIKTRKSRAPDD
jgi:putative RNA 2'-phosphotransferase